MQFLVFSFPSPQAASHLASGESYQVGAIGLHAGGLLLHAENVSYPVDVQEHFNLIVEHIRTHRKLTSGGYCGALTSKLGSVSGDHVELTCTCECDHIDERTTVTIREIEHAGLALGFNGGPSP